MMELGSVAGGSGASRHFDRFGQAAAHRSQHESGDFALWSQRNASSFPGKFRTAIQPQTRFFQKLSGETHVFGAIHAPKPELLLLALEKIQGLFEFFHRAIEG